MIRLRLSRKTLRVGVRVVGWLALALVALAGTYGLGTRVTPRDGGGRPVIWSPSVRATARYRSRAREWNGTMAEVDARLAALLSRDVGAIDPAALYAQEQAITEIGETSVALVRRVETTRVPVSLVGLRERALAAATAYREAARLTALWLSAPQETGRQSAVTALREARASRVQMEQSRWIINQ